MGYLSQIGNTKVQLIKQLKVALVNTGIALILSEKIMKSFDFESLKSQTICK